MDFHELSGRVLADVADCVRRVDAASVGALVEQIAARGKVFLIGTGRSGRVLDAMAIRLGHLGIEAHAVGSPDAPLPSTGDLVLVGSGSGRTPLVRERCLAARNAGAELALITADPGSPIAGLAALVVHIPAPVTPPSETCAGSPVPGRGRDREPHTLRSLFEECLLIVCDCVCRMLQQRLGRTADDMQSRHSTRE